ncbi:carbohydrate ABC transporter substrate-binding protein (CUT1 family) [Paenibacillus taihuensis]|uniref:Carbohydrate ABC transporter substrate-binding protein (CUT1 family) n=1 Tax=Paenibacillus taihuensis TaxID=1156355 RepID=A0A3D9RIH0_9BACL|nr:extracellular solute-binding protein [Paenibacillus taihuensis]REE78587.1 carbohydrate ABC transporter substrate-binding protein (CUT1 family) [Paenibacillus taihuensis]
MKTKQIVTLLAAVCLVTGLAGCGGSNNNTGNNTANSNSTQTTTDSSNTSTNTTDTAANTATNNTTDNQATTTPDKKLEISSIQGTWASPLPDPNGNGAKMINDKFNVDLKSQFVPYDEYANKLPVVMAAGDLPDMIGMEGVDANFVKWAKQGAFLPLNDYIDKYDAIKSIPKSVWDAVTVDGKIYAIPNYFPAKYGKKPIIRKDWLDNLGLSMPTTYDELKKVAIAFAKNDPDKNGKNDTLGLGLAKSIVYGAWMGAEWDSGWYNKNDKGQLIPGNISEGFKKQVTLLRDLYKEGAISKDWAVTKSADARKDFFAGKTGIYYEQPYDISETRFKQLKETNPTAELAVIPPFTQDDGQQGFIGLPGYYELHSLNANLKDDPDKINRILEMINYFMTFIPVDQRNDQNPEFDWQHGGVGKGYNMENGVALDIDGAFSEMPETYLGVRYWAPTDEDTQPAMVLQDPFTKSFVQSAVDLLKNTKTYLDPVNRVHSDLLYAKVSELDQAVSEHTTKMIVGQESVDDWDKMVQEYLSKGGQDIIDQVNQLLTDSGIQGEWK